MNVSSGGISSFQDSEWNHNTNYTYTLNGTRHYIVTDPNTGQSSPASEPVAISAVVNLRRVPATPAQTIDTRIDPRFSTYELKRYKFADTKYRGGLFAGYNADGSKVARTYLRFTGLTYPSPGGLWPVGGLSLYLTRTAQPAQPALIKARFVADDSWDAATLAWDNAPLPKESGSDAVSFSWAADTPGRWVTFNVLPDLENSFLQGSGASPHDGTLSVVLMTTEESSGGTPATFPLQATNGWAYFARAGYQQDDLTDIGPYLLYASGGSIGGVDVNSVFVPTTLGTTPPTPDPLTSNSSRGGTVSLSNPAPTGGYTLTLSSSSPTVTVPASVTIPAGQTSASFTVSSGTITQAGNVTISATLGRTVTKTVPVAP